MSPLTQAISSGFSSEQIIEFLLRKFPKYSKDIQKALGQGYSANTILKYLNKGRKGVNEIEGELTEHEKTRKSDLDKQKSLERNLGKGALALGGAALGAYGLSRGAQAVIPEVLPALQGAIQPKEDVEIDLTPKIAHQAKQIEFQPPNQVIQQAKGPESPPTIQTQIPQPETPKLDFGQILNQIGIKERVDNLRQNNPPEVISKIIRYILPKDQIKQIESQLKVPIDQIISGYISSSPQEPLNNQNVQENTPETQERHKMEFNSQELDVPSEEIKRGEIGSSVLLPDGQIGNIESVKQGIAQVNVDGKIRNKKEDELIESPLPEKDLADIYDDLIFGIEKDTGQQVSRNVYWAGYDPKTNELAFIPHHGALYVYNDISPEDAKELTSFLTPRKTTGENYIGAWESGSKSPIGAAMSLLIQRLQKQSGGKGKEYSGKFQKIYDALEPAKLLAKKKKEEERKNAKKKTKKPTTD